MLETLLITFREGLEAFLIVAIMIAYLTKTGRDNLIKPVYMGAGVALLISATTGYHIKEMAENPVTEGILALIAGALVASMTYYVMKTAKTIRQDIHSRIEHHAVKDGAMAEISIFLITVVMITREGMETALMLGAITAQTNAIEMLTGAIIGLALIAAIGYLWIKQSNKINLKLFMQVTGVFLIMFSIYLFVYGLHELSETGHLPGSVGFNQAVHEMTEPMDGHGPYAQFITYSLLIVPCAWLLASYFKDKFGQKQVAAE